MKPTPDDGYDVKRANPADVEDPGRTATPMSVRFPKSGPQILRIHVLEFPTRVDAIWLSTTKMTRPKPDERPGAR